MQRGGAPEMQDAEVRIWNKKKGRIGAVEGQNRCSGCAVVQRFRNAEVERCRAGAQVHRDAEV
jgi:hypothetical protein